MVEFAVVAPVILMLLAAIFLAFMYLWKTSNADWTLFAVGASAGSYDGPKAEVALRSVGFDTLKNAFSWSAGAPRTTAEVGFSRKVAGAYSISLIDLHRGEVEFRLWRFYPLGSDDR